MAEDDTNKLPHAEAVAPEQGPGQDGAAPKMEAAGATTTQDREQTFRVYSEALENADWGFKGHRGEERDLGFRSVMHAERAYVNAALIDEKKASKMYEEASGQPPKEALLQKLRDTRESNQRHSLDDLTAGILEVGKKREYHGLKAKHDELHGKLGTWKTNQMDALDRKNKHRREAHDEMMRQVQHRDDGLHIISGFRSGMRASSEYGLMFREGKRHKQISEDLSESEKKIRSVAGSIATFNRTEGNAGDLAAIATKGPIGGIARRFPGAIQVARRAMAGSRVEANVPQTEIGKAKPIQNVAAQMAKAAMGQGIGR